MKIKALELDSEYVFPEGHFRYNTFNDKVKEVAKAIGCAHPEKYSTHSYRATAATMLYLETNDIYQVQRLLRHTTPQMTMKYIKDLDIDKRLQESMIRAFDNPVTSGDQVLQKKESLKTA